MNILISLDDDQNILFSNSLTHSSLEFCDFQERSVLLDIKDFF